MCPFALTQYFEQASSTLLPHKVHWEPTASPGLRCNSSASARIEMAEDRRNCCMQNNISVSSQETHQPVLNSNEAPPAGLSMCKDLKFMYKIYISVNYDQSSLFYTTVCGKLRA